MDLITGFLFLRFGEHEDEFVPAVTGDDVAGQRIEERLGALRGCRGLRVFSERDRKTTLKTRLTVIGPAAQLKTIKKDRDLISALVSP